MIFLHFEADFRGGANFWKKANWPRRSSYISVSNFSAPSPPTWISPSYGCWYIWEKVARGRRSTSNSGQYEIGGRIWTHQWRRVRGFFRKTGLVFSRKICFWSVRSPNMNEWKFALGFEENLSKLLAEELQNFLCLVSEMSNLDLMYEPRKCWKPSVRERDQIPHLMLKHWRYVYNFCHFSRPWIVLTGLVIAALFIVNGMRSAKGSMSMGSSFDLFVSVFFQKIPESFELDQTSWEKCASS